VRAGMSPEAARDNARRRFGDFQRIKNTCTTIKEGGLMEILWRAGFLEVRRVVTHPTFTVVVMLGLTVAIGLNTFLYNFAGLIVRRPLPFQSADELVLISELDSEIGRAGFSSSLFLRLVNQSRQMKQMAGFSWDLMDISGDRVGIAYLTENLCSLLGTRPI